MKLEVSAFLNVTEITKMPRPQRVLSLVASVASAEGLFGTGFMLVHHAIRGLIGLFQQTGLANVKNTEKLTENVQ